MLIRGAKESEAVDITRVQVDAWQTTYKGIVPDAYLASRTYERKEQSWREILGSRKSDFTLVAETSDEQIVGFASAGETEEPDGDFAGELIAIYLLEAHQRQGVGKLLVEAVTRRFVQQNITSMVV